MPLPSFWECPLNPPTPPHFLPSCYILYCFIFVVLLSSVVIK